MNLGLKEHRMPLPDERKSRSAAALVALSLLVLDVVGAVESGGGATNPTMPTSTLAAHPLKWMPVQSAVRKVPWENIAGRYPLDNISPKLTATQANIHKDSAGRVVIKTDGYNFTYPSQSCDAFILDIYAKLFYLYCQSAVGYYSVIVDMNNLKLFSSESILAAYFGKKIILVDNINNSRETPSDHILGRLITPQFAMLNLQDDTISSFYFPQKIPQRIKQEAELRDCQALDQRSGLFPKDLLNKSGIIKLSHSLPSYINRNNNAACPLEFWIRTSDLVGGYK